MKANPFLSFWALYALLLTSCTSESPLSSESPEEARAFLADAGVPSSQASFLAAAEDGDLPLVKSFIRSGMAPNAQNEDQGFDTALMRAARQGHLDIVKFLVENGALLKDHTWHKPPD